MRIAELIEERQTNGADVCVSFEYFPPKTEQATRNLLERAERMCFHLRPLFIDVTWAAGGSSSETSLEVARQLQKYSGSEVMLHLTCTNTTREQIRQILTAVKNYGIRNIMALRGDPPVGQTKWTASEGGFEHASDLVRFIREEFGDYFGVAVAGYPEGHSESESLEMDIVHLKQKVDAGADLIITQLFYDTSMFTDFYRRCRCAGIDCPIVPGILPIQTYQSFERMTRLCHTKVPAELQARLSAVRQDDERVKELGVDVAVQMCRKLVAFGVQTLHFYTMNLEKSVGRVIESLGIAPGPKANPWRQSAARSHEGTRPVFWSCRPKSYIDRTDDWDEFPNGRWGDIRSPAFGDCQFPQQNLRDNAKQLRALWGEPTSLEAVRDVFLAFLSGSIRAFPWAEEEIQGETFLINPQLTSMNSHFLLTLTSQPNVNASPSTDPLVGWGPENGYIFQKALVEFFCPRSFLPVILAGFQRYPSLSYMYADRTGTIVSSMKKREVNAVTWGIFPNSEVKQPTIIDRLSFEAWRTEAFEAWVSAWAVIYPEDSPARTFLSDVRDQLYLVNVVDNDFRSDKLWHVLETIYAQLPPLS